MTDIDKFCSDADKLLERTSRPDLRNHPGTSLSEFRKGLEQLFLSRARNYGELAENLAAYRLDRLSGSSGSTEEKRAAVNWLNQSFALLDGTFSADMNFAAEDWEAIREIVSAEADTLDLDLLTALMSTILERGKFY